VHFDIPSGTEPPRPGDIVTVTVTQAAPFYLIADSPEGAPLRVRRTVAGDAWDRAQAASCAAPATPGTETGGGGRVSLGLPTLRVVTTPIYDSADGRR
jgi:tRNA-2-methylthio-N6-dimethylallyladenosine synthase